ncbi:MAG: ABC transporter ATP-binding protein [Halanaeroarchaeum sp.]
MSLEAEITARFSDGTTVFDVDAAIEVETGETLALLGPSGSGKTLVLETIAGFHDHGGRVLLDGEDVTDAPPEDRDLGLVFQDYALFPHLTVRENVAFGTRYHDDADDPDDLLEGLGVGHLADRSPPTLSGGEKQRIALARALAIRPRAFLLDEPLSALDAPTRESLRADLADVLADETALYVTHDRTTARALGDRIAVVRDGTIHQVGTPTAVFERPADDFVARFTGANVVPADAVGDWPDADDVAIRPEHVRLDGEDAGHRAVVVRTVREDATYRVTVRLDGTTIDAYTTAPPEGDRVGVTLPRDRCHPTQQT